MTALMLLNTAAISPVRAETMLGSDYTFVDTCYSPDTGLYAAVAKKLGDKSYTPAQIWVSDDMETWKKTKDFSQGIHNANPQTGQTMVWWDAMQKFVVQMNNKVYYSSDAVTWTAVKNDNINGSNQTIETNGDKLVISSRARLKVCSDLESDPEIYAIDPTPNNNTYGKAVGVTPKEPYSYMVSDQYRTWMIDSEGALSSADQNIQAHPTDMVWVSGFNGWIVVNSTAALRILASDQVKYSSFTAMVLSDGSSNTAMYTAAGASDAYVVVGTNTGKFYIAPNDGTSLTIDVPWEIAEAGTGEENTERIRSITAVDGGRFIAVSDKKLFIIEKNSEGAWRYYDVMNAHMELNEDRIEIPSEGSDTYTLEPINYNCKGEVSSDAVISFSLTSSLPGGITSEQINDTAIKLSVDSTASGGHTLKYKAVTESGKSQEFEITVVDEDHIEIQGPDSLAVPLDGEKNEVYEYSAAVIGTDGKKMSREVHLAPVEVPEGAEYDSASGRLTISKDVKAGEIVFEAYSVSRPSNKAEKRVKISLRAPEKIEFSEGEDEIYIPDNGSQNFTYAVNVYDQTGLLMKNAKTIWSLETEQTMPVGSLSLNAETGVLTVDRKAVMGTVKIKAASENDESVSCEKTVTLLYTDLRKANEDMAEFVIDTSLPVTENISLMPKRTFASTVTWRSSNEDIIKTDGTVIRPSRADAKVTLTQVVKQNKASVEKKFELTVKKADTLCTNGNLADGTTNGWQPKGKSEITAVTEGENTVLKAEGGGAYQVVTLTNDSSYGFEARVKSDTGKTIKLVSKKAGTLSTLKADGSYKMLKASYDYRKQKDSFDDEIYIECDGAVMIDELKVYEITLELNEVSAAVNRAKYTKKPADINNARKLLNNFYDLPIKNELETQLDKITVSDGSGNSGGGGGGGGGSKGTAPSKSNTNTGSSILPPDTSVKDEKGDEDKLDTFLLSFKDMKNHWAREDVEYMAKLGIASGDESGMYRPDDMITRAEFAALVTRAMGLSETPYENSFFDVVSDDWYSGYVQTCRSNDYMNGYDGLFNPYRNIEREEIAKVVVSAYNSKSGKQLETGKALYFNDIDSISYWAYDYIAEAQELGFVNGVTDELFAPKNSATRAEAAVMLRRMYDKLNNAG